MLVSNIKLSAQSRLYGLSDQIKQEMALSEPHGWEGSALKNDL